VIVTFIIVQPLIVGGKEAEHSNAILHQIVSECIESSSDGKVPGSLVGLVTSRAEIQPLLKLDDVIDLVIPRGSAALVRHIKNTTAIPVMGHAEGVCHIYVDAAADLTKATRIVVDAKTDYPSACNAVETVLFHEKTVESGVCKAVLDALQEAGVAVLGGHRAVSLGLVERKVEHFSTEYGDLTVAVEIVADIDTAIKHIHTFGSAHTDSIVTEDPTAADVFIGSVDSACVFHNASTRFADGFRFGLGAEVGISTSRLNPRGPVGVEGLLSAKWTLRSSHAQGSTVASFAKGGGEVYHFDHIL
jgi:gamma-glutamyl phosphate reductase